MNKSIPTPNKAISTLYFFCLGVIIFIPSSIYTYFIRGGQLSGISPAPPPSAWLGLEELRAALFRRGLSLPEGFADPIVGPLISQTLAVSERIKEMLPKSLVLPEQMQTHLLLCLCMLGLIWGTSLLYERWRAVFTAALLASISLGLVSHYAVDGLWFLLIFTWTSVGLTASWRDPSSSIRAGFCGLSLSVAVAASPLFLPIAVVYWLLSFWPRPRQEGESLWKAILVLPPLIALFGFALGMTPWLFRGQLSHPPLTVDQYLSPDLWIHIYRSVEVISPLRQAYDIFTPLVIMSGLTFMSAHTHRVTWSRRGIGLGALLFVALLLSPFIGWWCVLPPLLWVSIHPWSPLGTFLLLPFKPLFKRSISLLIFILILTPSIARVSEDFRERRIEDLSSLQREQIELANFFNDKVELQKMWVLGAEAHPLYAMTRLEGSALLPPQVNREDRFKLRDVHTLLKSELIDVVVLSESDREFAIINVGLKRLLEEEFHHLPASDYRWLDRSHFFVYVREGVLSKGPNHNSQVMKPPEDEVDNPRDLLNQDDKGEDDEGEDDEGENDEGVKLPLLAPSVYPPTGLKVEPELTGEDRFEDSDKDDSDKDDSDKDDSDKDDSDKDDSDKDDSDKDD